MIVHKVIKWSEKSYIFIEFLSFEEFILKTDKLNRSKGFDGFWFVFLLFVLDPFDTELFVWSEFHIPNEFQERSIEVNVGWSHNVFHNDDAPCALNSFHEMSN